MSVEYSPPHYARNYWELTRKSDALVAYAKTPEGSPIAEVVRDMLGAAGGRSGNDDPKSNTEIAYKRDQAVYEERAREAGVDPTNPPIEWLSEFFKSYAVGRRFGTVQRMEAAVINYFFQRGQPSPTRTFTHKSVMRQMARREARPTRKATPLYGDTLKALLSSYYLGTPRGLRDYVIIIAGGVRALRSSSIVNIHVEDLQFDPDGLVIALRNEKTATNAEPLFAATPHSATHAYCMPCAFRQLVDFMTTIGLSGGPLFRHIDRWGHFGARHLTPKSVSLIIRAGLRRIGNANAAQYSSHSLRHGVVAAAVDRDYSDREIMLLTGHRSLKGLQAYTMSRNPWRDAPKRLVLDDASATPTPYLQGWRHDP